MRTCYAEFMIRSRTAIRQAFRIFAATLALTAPAAVFAQAQDISFDVEIYRVDLVRGDDGEIGERFTSAEQAFPGEVIEYRVNTTNAGDVIYRAGTVIVTLPIGEGSTFQIDNVTRSSTTLVTEVSTDGGESWLRIPAEGEEENASFADLDPAAVTTLRWTFTSLFEPDQTETLVYRVLIQ